MIKELNFDRYFNFNRAIASKITPFLVSTPLRPNHITSLALILGVVAAFFMSQATRFSMLAGAFFLQVHFILDDCDGSVARLKSMQSTFGMWYDFVADVIVDFFIWVGLALGAVAQGVGNGIFIFCAIACLGSGINFIRVTTERVCQPAKDSAVRTKNPLFSVLDVLSQDGDPSLLIWILAIIGSPSLFLILGAVYINVIWIFPLVVHSRNL